MSNVQISNVPSPCPLSVGGPDTEQLGFKEPMKWMRESKKITMEECRGADLCPILPIYVRNVYVYKRCI